jgi:hypothetical protein
MAAAGHTPARRFTPVLAGVMALQASREDVPTNASAVQRPNKLSGASFLPLLQISNNVTHTAYQMGIQAQPRCRIFFCTWSCG